MSVNKIIIDADPGIGDAIAIAVALHDPRFEVVGITATAGAVTGKQANQNLQLIVDGLDLEILPRIGWCRETLPRCSIDNSQFPIQQLYGASGLGECDFATALPHSRMDSPKLIADLVRQHPNEITIVCLGPLTNIALATERYSQFFQHVKGIVTLAGSTTAIGDVTSVAEFNVYADPESANAVFQSEAFKIMVPLEARRGVKIGFADLDCLPLEDSLPFPKLLSQLIPFGLRARREFLGEETIGLDEVLAVATVSHPHLVERKTMHVDVEENGDLTRGMTVFDTRRKVRNIPNVDVISKVDKDAVIDYFSRVVCNSTR